MKRNEEELLKGGQGRTKEEVEAYAFGCLFAALGILALVILGLLLK